MSNNLSSTFEVLIERHNWNFFVKKNFKKPQKHQNAWSFINTYRANENNKKKKSFQLQICQKMLCYSEIKFKDWREI